MRGTTRLIIVTLGTLLCRHSAMAQGAAHRALRGVLPRPATVEVSTTAAPFVLTAGTTIVIPDGSAALREVAQLLAAEIRVRTGRPLMITHQSSPTGVPAAPVIRLDTLWSSVNREAYAVSVDDRGIVVSGASSAGTRWGVQTLLQLLARENARTQSDGWQVAASRITDAPRFAWRGSMVDVGRHYLPVRDIERHIDLLSRYKMNVMHWHLTEDQGWRLEIKRYPRLTSVGAWRTEADGSRYGGFYTQAQVRHLVAYARTRGVTIVPEIELPGHSSAAIAAYPMLGCSDAPVAVATSWGVFADIYCAGKPTTLPFLFGVLDEVMDLFPSPVIHIGGDEAPKDRWKACALCQGVMQREGLANEEQLQSWFMRQIAHHVAQRGRRVMGWDEVMDGPYVPGGMVQSWRDSSFTRTAVMRGFDVIASPSDFTYFNRSAGELRVADVYRYEPMPPGLDAAQSARVLGAEAPLWSEHIVSSANLELMALPRLLAFAELLWSAAPRDLAEVQRRLDDVQLPNLRAEGYAVGLPDGPIASMSVRYDSVAKRPMLRVSSLAPGVVVRATTDGRRPTPASPMVRDGAILRADSVVRVQTFWGTSPVLEPRRVTMTRHDAIGARVRTEPAVDARYPGTGPFNLVDGMTGSGEHGDGLWQGWWVPEVAITVELAAPMDVARVDVRFLQNLRSWMLLPGTVSFSWSADGSAWSVPVRTTHQVSATREGAIVQPFGVALPRGSRARFVRVVATARGPLPVGHPGAGQAAWLFADEVRVVGRRLRGGI